MAISKSYFLKGKPFRILRFELGDVMILAVGCFNRSFLFARKIGESSLDKIICGKIVDLNDEGFWLFSDLNLEQDKRNAKYFSFSDCEMYES